MPEQPPVDDIDLFSIDAMEPKRRQRVIGQAISDELVVHEVRVLAGGVCRLDWFPVRPSTIIAVYTLSGVSYDDGNGNMVDSYRGSVVGTVNYITGTITITGIPADAEIRVTYAYDSGVPRFVFGPVTVDTVGMLVTIAPAQARALD